jgi:hypothetical protein
MIHFRLFATLIFCAFLLSYCKTPKQGVSTGDVTAPDVVQTDCDEDVYAPVIGSDGKAYLNACRAIKAGTKVQSEGYDKKIYDLLNTATWPIEAVCNPRHEMWDTIPPQDLEDGTLLYVNKEGITFRGSRNQCKCLSASTLIDCPQGQILVSELQIGDSVYTNAMEGYRVAVVIRDIHKIKVEPTHRIVELTLADGRQLRVSPGHPASDSYTSIEHYSIGDTLDGSAVISKEYTTLGDTCTYDILPKSWLGDYWANGILIGSTMRFKYMVDDVLEMGW